MPFLSLMLCDIFCMKYVSIKQSFTEFLVVNDAIKLRLNYHQFSPLYQQNQNKKLIGKVKILSIKVISNQYLNCYISAVLQLLISTSVSEMLPSQLQSNSTLNCNIHFVRRNLHSTSNYPYSFSQCDRKIIHPKVPILGQILTEVLQKDYRKKEMVFSSELMTSLISKLFEDEITDNPFEIIFTNLEQCLACNFTEGEIEENNYMRIMVWDSDRNESIRLQLLIWDSYCCNLEMKSNNKCSN